MDRKLYDNACLNIIDNKYRFKPLDNDPTLLREGRLQRFFRNLKKQVSIDNQIYSSVSLRGSQPARSYGLPKLHKHRQNNNAPPIRPIVSSTKSYNYNLSKCLCTLLNPVIPNDYTT